MCGVLGLISKNPIDQQERCQHALHKLEHRGPNGKGVYFSDDQKVFLGHRRLSVQDLSDHSAQPMHSVDYRYTVVFNGEIYNFKELRHELVTEFGVSFSSTGDTEVLLAAFINWGIDCLSRFNGMFAFAIYDSFKDECFLARDRMGIKPLYYYADGKQVAFSSELKGIKHLPNMHLQLDSAAVCTFLNLGYIPAPLSIWTNVRKLSPGTYLRIGKNREVTEVTYWNLKENIKGEKIANEVDAKSHLVSLLRDSIQKRLISDVPVGTFLSGGIDSSLVTALAVENSNSLVKSFSIGFEDKNKDESVYAEKVAKHIGTQHTTFRMTSGDLSELYEDYFDWFDEPFADSSAFPTYAVSKMAKEHVTVALSGDGGDELGFGYGSYQWARRMSNPMVYSMRSMISSLLLLAPSARWRRAAKVFQIPDRKAFYSHIFSQEQYLFSQFEINNLVNIETRFGLEEAEKFQQDLTPQENFALMDLKFYLPDDLLTKVDRTSMARGLECRTPLLDHHVVAYMLNLSPDLKYSRHLGSKHILKSILFDYVPKQFFDRPKQGFSVPLNSWLNGALKTKMNQSEEILAEVNWINKDALHKLFSRYLGGDTLLYNRVWQLMILGHFLHKHQIK